MSRFPQYNVNNQHELIRRQNTYVLDRKLVTIHSEDRDVNKWPNSNQFEVSIPENITNVQSMRLVEIQLPANYYVFSNAQQNTKLTFRLQPNIRDVATLPVYLFLLSNPEYTIEIQEGSYTPNEIALEIQNLMNSVVNDYITQHVPGYTYTYFKVKYDKVGQKLFFGNSYDNFSLEFGNYISYNVSCESTIHDRQPINIWNQYTKWGLPSYLGFSKDSYQAQDTSGIIFNYDSSANWLEPDPTEWPPLSPATQVAYYVKSPYTFDTFGDSAVYMEVDKYNSIDELKPYSEATNETYNNDYNGRANSAFAKIPINVAPSSRVFDSRNGFLQNVSQYHPPIEKIKKLKITFRYHDGRLVEFKESNFNFTIAFNQLRDEIARDYVVRVPEEYRL